MLSWYRALIALRREYASLTDGDLAHVRVAFDEAELLLKMTRGNVTLAINVSQTERSITVPAGTELRLASSAAIGVSTGQVSLPPDSVAVLIGLR
jgi:maltooligosyltrehalose trehalohydrolase